MGALHLVAEWPVEHAAAAVVTPEGVIETHGDVRREFRLASISKCLTGWATMVAWEEGIVDLDGPLEHAGVPAGASMRHLLSHASGLPFEGTRPTAAVGTRRIYSNTGIELAAEIVAAAAEMPFGRYLAEAVFEPLGMGASELRGSAAHAAWSTAAGRRVVRLRAVGTHTARARDRPRCHGDPVPRSGGYRSRCGVVRSMPVGARGGDQR